MNGGLNKGYFYIKHYQLYNVIILSYGIQKTVYNNTKDNIQNSSDTHNVLVMCTFIHRKGQGSREPHGLPVWCRMNVVYLLSITNVNVSGLSSCHNPVEPNQIMQCVITMVV